MANIEISDLDQSAVLTGSELLEIEQSGASKKITAAQIMGARPTRVAGRWYCSVPATLAAGSAFATAKIKLHPFFVEETITISDAGARLTTPAASGNFQLAIYDSDPTTGYPTGTALASTGSITTASAGALSADITGANVQLTPGLYWGAVNVDASAGTVAVFQTINAAFSWGGFLIGSTTLANITGAATSVTWSLQADSAYNTWPDLTGATFSEVTAVHGPALFYKVASVP